ncbi:MAG: hypothetical protein AAFW81_04630, partial [Pseudomonadota bacterium]
LLNKEKTLQINTSVENRGRHRKQIDTAFIFISPQDGKLLSHMSICMGQEIKCTNDFVELVDRGNNECGRVGEIYWKKIPFYYSENVAVSDEVLTFALLIDTADFQVNQPYSVRFFLVGEKRLHRSTQCGFVVPAQTNQFASERLPT